MDNYYKLGMLFCFVGKLEECLNINLPSSFWKYLLGNIALLTSDGKLVWEDIKLSDLNQWGCIDKIEKMKEDEFEYFAEKYTTFLSNGQEFELVPYGKEIDLTQNNKSEYIHRSKQIYLSQFVKAFEMARKGFLDSTFSYFFKPMTPLDLENEISGVNYVDISLLKRITVYHSFPGSGKAEDHQSVKWFWAVLERFSQQELAGYLRYVWGRSRLSHAFGDTHKLSFVAKHKNQIPEAHTCFFELDLGTYASEAELNRLLRYGIQNCTEISETSKRFNFAADFGLD